MLDVNRAIASNPQDWKAYRDRGWIYAHKHEFDRALADLDMALRLKPDDARAYTRRGHIWKAAGQIQKAIVDYEAAMRLDLANADAYRDMIRKAQGGENAKRPLRRRARLSRRQPLRQQAASPDSSRGWRSTTPNFSPPTSRSSVFRGDGFRMSTRKGAWSAFLCANIPVSSRSYGPIWRNRSAPDFR
jgi:tetratricopeptide (TPR) repeat protein